MPDAIPKHAEIVIIGAGAIGTAIAWQLAAAGKRDVLVLEKSGITHGSTWHAAGLVGQFRSHEDLTRVMQTSVALFDEIEAETPVDWRRVGSLRLASSRARWDELKDGERQARDYGVDYHLITPAEAAQRFPQLSLDGVKGAAWIAGDGYVDPSAVTLAYARRARALGVQIREGVTVTGLTMSGRDWAVTTDKGKVSCATLVIASGVWAHAMGVMLGQSYPVAALEHQYAITEKHASISRDLPALRDPDLNFYLKPDAGAFAIGGWDAATIPVHGSLMPTAFGQELLAENLDRLQPILEAAVRRIPLVGELGLKRIINGPIPVSPDGEPLLGPAPGHSGLFLAIGFTSGIAASAGAGQALARWIVDGKPAFPLPSLDPRRFGTAPLTAEEINHRAIQAYALYYALSRTSASKWKDDHLSS
jgi:sarcosine dehydrogenase